MGVVKVVMDRAWIENAGARLARARVAARLMQNLNAGQLEYPYGNCFKSYIAVDISGPNSDAIVCQIGLQKSFYDFF